MPLSKFLNNKKEQAPVNAAGASSAYNPFAKLLEDNFMLNKKVQSETLDFLSSETGISNKPLNLDASKYAPYDVYINDINTEEELNKERANNQSGLEQTGRMVGQMVGSEVILGSLRGLSDILDAGIELVSQDKDFTNSVSSYLEELQNEVRERLEIYRENPDAAWDIADYGWWTNNAVSIASTLSLAIPGGVYAKGLSLLCKSIGATKALRNGLKLISKHPNLRTKQIGATSELLAHAGLMRTAEGYIEARDTYNQVKDEISAKLGQMTPQDKEELIKRNPSFAGLTDEQIAEKAAGESADDVFKDDYWLMLLDAWQLKSLRNLGKGFKNIATNQTIREAQAKSINNLVGRTTVQSKGFKNYINGLDASSLKVIGAELSEGFEEGYQYIQQQEGIDKARQIIEPNYKARGYADYIADPHMWEQAFWGWMGGVAFQGLGSAANKIAAKYISKNEDLLTRQRTSEIESRISALSNFSDNIRKLRDENINPFITIEGQNPEVSDDERDALIEYAFEKLVTDMTINAAKKGNFDLLKEFFSSEEFQEHINKLGVLETEEEKQYMADIISHMDEVYDIFDGEVNHIINNDITNRGTIEKIASDNTYLRLASKSAQRQIDKYDAEINEARKRYANNPLILNRIDEVAEAVKLNVYKEEIDKLNKEITDANVDLANKRINKAQHNTIVRNNSKAKQALYRELNFSATPVDEVISDAEFNTHYNDNNNNNLVNNIWALDNELATSIYNKAYQELYKNRYYDSNIARTKNEIQTKAKVFENSADLTRIARLADAMAKLDDIYENNDIDTVLDYIYGNKNANLTNDVKSSIDKAIGDIKVYDESDEYFSYQIVNAAEKKAKEKGARPVATVNGNGINVKPNINVPPTPQPQPQKDNEDEDNEDDAPTGGLNPIALGLINEDSQNEDSEQLNAEKKARETEEWDDVGSKLNSSIVSIIGAAVKTDDFKNLSTEDKIEYVKNELRQLGYKEEDINNNLNTINSWVRQISRNLNIRRSAIDLDSLTKEDIILNSVLGIDLSDDFFKKALQSFKENHKVLTLNGKTYFDMISFLKYIAESNEIVTFEGLKAVHDKFNEYVLSNENYIFPNNRPLSNKDINAIIEGLDLSPVETDNRIGILSKEQARKVGEAVFNIALHNVNPGDKLQVKVERDNRNQESGIGFYKNGVKIAFNQFGKKSNRNNGYTIKKSGFEYNLWQDINGEYHSDLDEIFNSILGDELTPEVIEFLEYLLDNTKLTKDNTIQFWNNSIAKNILEYSIDKTVTYNNAVKVLNYIRNIYNYDISTDHFDKRLSYAQWVQKEYNNYKFTDSLRNVKEVSVNYVSHGTAIPGEPTDIDKAVVNFNLKDHHLGFVYDNEKIRDTKDGSELQAPGFRYRGLVVILPNGTNAPTYSKIIPQTIDYSNGLGKAIKDELTDILYRHMTAEDNFNTTKDKLMSIFNYAGLVNDVICIETDGRIIISTPDNYGEDSNSLLPIITIYKKQADGVEDSTGISVNVGKKSTYSVGRLDLTDEMKYLIEQGINKLLADSTFTLSYDFLDNAPTTNKYITKLPDGKLKVTIGGQENTYENYLDFIVKNHIGKIALGKINLAQGLGYKVETNFAPITSDYRTNINIRVNPVEEDKGQQSQTPRRRDIEQLEADISSRPNATVKNKSTNVIIKTVAPSFVDYKVLKNEGFISDKIDIVYQEKIQNGNRVRADYNPATKKITLYKDFFTDAKDSEYNAMRIIIHENVHRAIAEINNPFKREEFLDGIREIRDTFLDTLESGNSRDDKLVEYLKSIGKNPYTHIAAFKALFDNNNSELYNLEEFIAESLTSNVLQGVLNNIESTRSVTVQTENLSLWQRIIQAIRKLFGFGDIKDNTLLAQEFEIFADNFKLTKSNEENVTEAEAIEENDTSYEGINEFDGSGYDSIEDDFDDFEIKESAIDLDAVPNLVSLGSQLSISERAKFEASLTAGQIQMYCR